MNNSNFLSTNAHWFLRLGLVSVFLYHGALKFSNLQGFADMLPISYTEVVLVAIAEVGGSLLLIAGGFSRGPMSPLFTRIGALVNIPVLLGAISMVHWGRWNFVPTEAHPMGGMEFQAVLIFIMIYFLIVGNKDSAVANTKEYVTG